MGVLSDLLHVVNFWYVKKKYTLYVIENNFSGTSVVGFVLGAGWTKVEFTPGTMEFSEKQSDKGGEGGSYEHGFIGQLAGNNFVYPDDLKAMTDEPVICKLELSNGLILVIGNSIIPVRMRYAMATKDHDCVVSFERNCPYRAMEAGVDIYLPPPVPVAIAVSGITPGGFTAGWNKTATAIGYYLDVSVSNTFNSFVTGYHDKNLGDVSSFAVTGLAPNTLYYYRVRAYNEHNTSNYSNVVSGTTAQQL